LLAQRGHHELSILLVEGWLRCPLWGGTATVEASINQKGPYWGVVKISGHRLGSGFIKYGREIEH